MISAILFILSLIFHYYVMYLVVKRALINMVGSRSQDINLIELLRIPETNGRILKSLDRIQKELENRP